MERKINMKFSSPALVVFSLLCSRFGHVSSADVEVDPLGRVRNLGASKSAKATSSPTGSPTASPTASPTKGPIGSPTDPPSALLEESFLEGRTADVDATASVAKNDDGPELIVGGTDATRGAYPYYVYIGEDTNGVCGGSLIAPRTVLTAAHCNVDANGDFTRDDVYVGREVRIGALAFPPRFPDADDGSVTATVIRQIIHPDYVDIVTETGSNLVNDFMLFYLDEEVEVDNPNNIQLRLRDDEGDIEPGTVLTAVGLGDSTVGDPAVFPDTLQELNNLIALPDNFCETLRPDVAMCAAAPVKTNVVDGDQNICGGDSGGPLVLREGNIHYQVGVVSYGPGSCLGLLPSFYAQIPDNDEGFQFIQEVTCGEFGDFATFCICESDCDCFDGGHCVCEEQEVPEERRFLEATEGEYKFLLDDTTVKDNKPGEERFNFHRSKNRRQRRLSSSSSGKGKGGKSCKSVKCSKSSKSSDGEVGVCRL